LQERKKASLKSLITSCRDKLHSLWDQSQVPDDLRIAAFPQAFVEAYTDEMYEDHEREIVRLQARLDSMQPLLPKLGERTAVLDRQAEYELNKNDPKR